MPALESHAQQDFPPAGSSLIGRLTHGHIQERSRERSVTGLRNGVGDLSARIKQIVRLALGGRPASVLVQVEGES